MNEPLVLPVRPVWGWRSAEPARRWLAASVVPLIALWAVLLDRAPETGEVLTAVTALTVGPPAFWSLARVVRPHVGDGWERGVRHAVAATATCLGTTVVVGIAVNAEEAAFLAGFAALATFGLVVTLPWAVAALVVRTLRVPVAPPAQAAWAGGTET